MPDSNANTHNDGPTTLFDTVAPGSVDWLTLLLLNGLALLLLSGCALAWYQRLFGRTPVGGPAGVPDAAPPAWRLPWLDFAIFLGSAIVLVWFSQNAIFAGMFWWSGERADPATFGLRETVLFGLTVQLPLLAVVFGGKAIWPDRFPARLCPVILPTSSLITVALDRFLRFVPLIFALNVVWGLGLQFLHDLGWIGEPQPQDLVLSFLEGGSPATLLGFIILAVIIAPITEEFFFRACLFRYFKGVLSLRLAMAASAFFFALIHANLHSFAGLFCVGLILASLYQRTGDLRTAILFHALFNATSLTLLMIVSRLGIEG